MICGMEDADSEQETNFACRRRHVTREYDDAAFDVFFLQDTQESSKR